MVRITARYDVDKERCDDLSDDRADVCKQEVKARRDVALAELDHHYSGSAADERKVRTVLADGNHAVAKERCDALPGNLADVCEQEAKSAHCRALADVR